MSTTVTLTLPTGVTSTTFTSDVSAAYYALLYSQTAAALGGFVTASPEEPSDAAPPAGVGTG